MDPVLIVVQHQGVEADNDDLLHLGVESHAERGLLLLLLVLPGEGVETRHLDTSVGQDDQFLVLGIFDQIYKSLA